MHTQQQFTKSELKVGNNLIYEHQTSVTSSRCHTSVSPELKPELCDWNVNTYSVTRLL